MSPDFFHLLCFLVKTNSQLKAGLKTSFKLIGTNKKKLYRTEKSTSERQTKHKGRLVYLFLFSDKHKNQHKYLITEKEKGKSTDVKQSTIDRSPAVLGFIFPAQRCRGWVGSQWVSVPYGPTTQDFMGILLMTQVHTTTTSTTITSTTRTSTNALRPQDPKCCSHSACISIIISYDHPDHYHEYEYDHLIRCLTASQKKAQDADHIQHASPS